MITTSPLRKICGLKTNMGINGIRPHLGTTVTMAAAQEGTPPRDMPRMIPGHHVLHGPIRKIPPLVRTAVSTRPLHRKDPPIRDLLANETRETTPGIHLETIKAQVDNGDRGNRVHLGGRSHLLDPGNSMENSHHHHSTNINDLQQASNHLPNSQGLSHLRQHSKDSNNWDKHLVHSSSHNSQRPQWEQLSPPPQFLAQERVQLSSNLSQVRLQHRQDNSQEDHPLPSRLLLW